MADRSVVVRLIADTSSYNSQMRGAAQSTRQVGEAGRGTNAVLAATKTALAGIGVGTIVKTGIEFDALKQRSQAAFTTITGSASTAKKELADLYSEFSTNPFGYPQILKSAQMLLAMGGDLQSVNREVRDLSDATAAVGGNADLLDRVALAFGQMRAKGTIQAEEMRQLAENGIPAWQMLAHEIGVSVPEAMKLVERRQVSSQVGIDALLTGIEKRFGGATANIRNTWTGTWAQFKAEATQAAGEVVKPIMRIGADGMHAMQPLLGAIGQVGSAFSGLPTPIQNTALALGAVMLLSGRLNSAWAGLTSVGGRFAEQMRVQMQLAAMSGVQITRMSAAMTVARMRAAAMGGAMLSAFGGPVGLAIIGATIGLSIYQQRQQDAAAAVARHRTEVQGLTNDIDRNTLALNRNAVDTKLASLTYGADPKGNPYKVLDYLNQIPGAAQVARRALRGNTEALAQLRRMLTDASATGKFEYGARAAFNAVAGAARNAREAAAGVANEMRLRIPDAAHATGLSTRTVAGAFDRWVKKGGDLKKQLRDAGISAKDAATIFNILAGAANNAAGAFGGMGNAAAQMRSDIANAASQFATVTGAWDTATSNAQNAAGSSGGGGSSSYTDDPGYKQAKKRYEDAKKALRDLKQADKDRLQPLKDTAKRERDAADAAEKRATALKKVADAAKKASREAQDAVKAARAQKDQADRNARDAAALAAAVKDQAGRAGTSDRGAYAAAQAKANYAVTVTAAEKAAAARKLTAAAADAAEKKAADKQAEDAYSRAKKLAARLDKIADRSEAIVKARTRAIERIERMAERNLERLLNDKEKAERKAQKASEKSTAGVSASYSGMADDAHVSLNQYLDTLEQQVRAQRDWKNNLIELAAKVPPGVVQQLAKLGPQAAPLVQQLVDGTDAQLGRFVTLFSHTGDDAASALAGQIQVGSALIASVANSAGTKAAEKLAKGIRDGRISVHDALAVLGGEFDKKTMKVKLGLKNPKAIADAIDKAIKNTVYLIKPLKTSVHGQQGFRVTGTTTVFGMKKGGWVRGGSGMRDDVPVATPNWRGAQLRAMGGEFMVRKDIAQRNKAFFDLMDRTGRMPQPTPQVVFVTAPAAGPSKSIHVGPVVQQPGQSARDFVREIDRLADVGSGP